MKYHMFNTWEIKCEANKVCILRDEKGKSVILLGLNLEDFFVWCLGNTCVQK
jgi:hypothetical protein